MSLLACDRDPRVVGVVVDGYWELEALSEHVKTCALCACVQSAMAAAMGSRGGSAGRGAAKRRGSSEYYRTLAARRLKPAR
jgi:hypothetical protein